MNDTLRSFQQQQVLVGSSSGGLVVDKEPAACEAELEALLIDAGLPMDVITAMKQDWPNFDVIRAVMRFAIDCSHREQQQRAIIVSVKVERDNLKHLLGNDVTQFSVPRARYDAICGKLKESDRRSEEFLRACAEHDNQIALFRKKSAELDVQLQSQHDLIDELRREKKECHNEVLQLVGERAKAELKASQLEVKVGELLRRVEELDNKEPLASCNCSERLAELASEKNKVEQLNGEKQTLQDELDALRAQVQLLEEQLASDNVTKAVDTTTTTTTVVTTTEPSTSHRDAIEVESYDAENSRFVIDEEADINDNLLLTIEEDDLRVNLNGGNDEDKDEPSSEAKRRKLDNDTTEASTCTNSWVPPIASCSAPLLSPAPQDTTSFKAPAASCSVPLLSPTPRAASKDSEVIVEKFKKTLDLLERDIKRRLDRDLVPVFDHREERRFMRGLLSLIEANGDVIHTPTSSSSSSDRKQSSSGQSSSSNNNGPRQSESSSSSNTRHRPPARDRLSSGGGGSSSDRDRDNRSSSDRDRDRDRYRSSNTSASSSRDHRR